MNIRSNISEKGKEICVTAELPGLTEEDVSVTGDRIVIEGRKKSEQEKKCAEKGREFDQVQRAFQQMMTLPFQIDPDAVDAVIKNSILTPRSPSRTKLSRLSKRSR